MFISEIQRQVAARHIACLVHFTSTTSLEGIVRDGKILSTQRLLDRSPMIVETTTSGSMTILTTCAVRFRFRTSTCLTTTARSDPTKSGSTCA